MPEDQKTSEIEGNEAEEQFHPAVELTNKKKPKITKQMLKFAQLLDKGFSPEEAARRTLYKGTQSLSRSKQFYQDKSLDLLRKCQEAMLIDVSQLVPKATQKIAELLEAKDPVYYKGEEVGEKPNHNVQLRAAEKIVDMVKPSKEDSRPSLIQQVIQINNYEN